MKNFILKNRLNTKKLLSAILPLFVLMLFSSSAEAQNNRPENIKETPVYRHIAVEGSQGTSKGNYTLKNVDVTKLTNIINAVSDEETEEPDTQSSNSTAQTIMTPPANPANPAVLATGRKVRKIVVPKQRIN